jgi:WD40 repeat protein
MKGHTSRISCITYSPNGQILAGGGSDGTIRQWVAATGEPFGPVIRGIRIDVRNFAYTHNGEFLASVCCGSRTISQYDANTGELFGSILEGHTGFVTRVCYSPDGKYLASSDTNHTVRQWVAASGEPFGPVLIGHTDSVYCIAYSPDGHRLASCGDDHRICVWEAHRPFNLLWCTRSAGNALLAVGLRMLGAVGLRADQRALLEYAGWRQEEPPSASGGTADDEEG